MVDSFQDEKQVFHNSIVIESPDSFCFGISLFCSEKKYLSNFFTFRSTNIGIFLAYISKRSRKHWLNFCPKLAYFMQYLKKIHNRPLLLVLFSEFVRFFQHFCYNLCKSLRLLNYNFACWIVKDWRQGVFWYKKVKILIRGWNFEQFFHKSFNFIHF